MGSCILASPVLVPARYAVGTWNFRDIALNDLVGKYNDFLCSVIVRVNEARDVGDANRGRIDRYGLHDHMKALMASPPETHRINRKYIPEYISLSRAGFITTSNHDDALYLPADDRRNAIAKSECTSADFHKDYFNELVLVATFVHGGAPRRHQPYGGPKTA